MAKGARVRSVAELTAFNAFSGSAGRDGAPRRGRGRRGGAAGGALAERRPPGGAGGGRSVARPARWRVTTEDLASQADADDADGGAAVDRRGAPAAGPRAGGGPAGADTAAGHRALGAGLHRRGHRVCGAGAGGAGTGRRAGASGAGAAAAAPDGAGGVPEHGHPEAVSDGGSAARPADVPAPTRPRRTSTTATDAANSAADGSDPADPASGLNPTEPRHESARRHGHPDRRPPGAERAVGRAAPHAGTTRRPSGSKRPFITPMDEDLRRAIHAMAQIQDAARRAQRECNA